MTDLSMVRGDDVTFDLPIAGLEDSLQVTFTAKRSLRDDDIDALLRKDLGAGVAVDADALHVSILAADTRDRAAPIVLTYDVEVIDAAGLTTTVALGYLRIEADVTRVGGGFGSGSGSGS